MSDINAKMHQMVCWGSAQDPARAAYNAPQTP